MATRKKVKEDEPVEATPAEEQPYEDYSLVQVPVPTKNDFITNVNRRSDDDALHLHACRVVDGEHKGRYGVLKLTSSLGKDGYPAEVVMETLDPEGERLTVNYADLRPDLPGRW